MVVYDSGGDGVVTPFCKCGAHFGVLWTLLNCCHIIGFVGYYPALQSVVVSNQGTDPSKLYVHNHRLKTLANDSQLVSPS